MDEQFHLKLFPQQDVETIARVVEAIRARRTIFVQRWHERQVAQFGTRCAHSEQLFQESYVPYLRSAFVRLAGGDAEGFVASAAILGENLARRDVPFAVLVAHLQLLKETALELLGDGAGLVPQDVLVTIDKLTACCISAAGDSYYRWLNGQAAPRVGEGGERNESEPRRLPSLLETFYGMVGRSPAMQRIFAQITQLAASSAPVLVCGETGTGKELIARAIHDAGPRRDGPFIAVNCAALPRELIESELFGYRKGAFSGAVADHVGLFRAAAGGTVLLDEITEMNPELQAKLLRVVQEMTVRPVGSVDEVPLNVRLVASTNRDPTQAVGGGTLRSDLYYRLSASVISVPPLREREDDLLPLIEHQLAVLNARYQEGLEGPRSVTADAMRRLHETPWLGNVRELFNVIESAFTGCQSLHIGVDDLTLPATPGATPDGACEPAAAQTFQEGERVLIERALSSTGGNKRRAAQLLGISRKKLYARLAKYALPVVIVSPMMIGPLQPVPLVRAVYRRVPAGPRARSLSLPSRIAPRTAR